MLIDAIKVLIPLLGGGAAGALINEWLRRRSGKVQAIPLVERVNRAVRPELKGFALARTSKDGRLEEVEDVREYQFTLRNTSAVHLQDAEIQFEFPAEDVEGWAERPALSNTPALLLDAAVTPPWKKAFRWRIPQFPATDSMEFTFRAVDPESEEYDVALYKSDRVVIEKSKRDVGGRGRQISALAKELSLASFLAAMGAGVGLVGFASTFMGGNKDLSSASAGGCSITVVSSIHPLNPGALPWQGPWRMDYELTNQGALSCKVKSSQLPGGTADVRTEFGTMLTAYSKKKPKESSVSALIGIDGPTSPITLNMYVPNNPQH